ncbi:MAG: TA system VapC family ribonuclease toxin [Burkholderiales bacterium]
MRALLDVNVWIALLDHDHVFAVRCNKWIASERPAIATCPIIENGVIRIMSSAGYSSRFKASAADVADLLGKACSNNDHAFWPDDLTLRNKRQFDVARLHGPRQITDAYLLALAVAKGGRFVTLDAAIPLSPVRGASKDHLIVL